MSLQTKNITKTKLQVSGLRLLGMAAYVDKGAKMYDVSVSIESHHQGLLLETVEFVATGEAASMEKFAQLFPK